MKIRGLKSFIYQALGIESKWLDSEKVNIFITAIMPAIIGLISVIFTILDKRPAHLGEIFKDDIFINSMQLVVICCIIYVIFRNRRRILVTNMMEQRLSSYVKEKCNLRDQSEENVKSFMDVIRKTMNQFFYTWIVLWAILFVYYSGSLCFTVFSTVGFESINCEVTKMIMNGYNNVFNYLSSTAMFLIFIILNSVTVLINERKRGLGLIYSVILIVVFGCMILLPTLYSFSLFGMSYFKTQLLITIILGFYSTFSFVLVLGKLNSNSSLYIPRFLIYGSYVYAIAQMFLFLFTFMTVSDYCWGTFVEFIDYLLEIELIFKYITLIGKVFLSLSLLWIVSDSKIIYFVIQQSQALIEAAYRKDVFDTYMKDIS